jgi:hypothetical protein
VFTPVFVNTYFSFYKELLVRQATAKTGLFSGYPNPAPAFDTYSNIWSYTDTRYNLSTTAVEAMPGRPNAKPVESVKIRLDEGDYALLQDIAREQGSKASVLIRQAIKQIIKAHAVSLRQEEAGAWNGKQRYPTYTPYGN